MFLVEPGQTNYDIKFSLFGFPIRVHPAFFILPLLIGQGFVKQSNVNTGVGLLLVAAIFFVSILIHELGHALAFRFYGMKSRIVLYWMGGLAIPDSGAWSPRRSGALTPNQQIVISFAGPLFGFLLAAGLVGVVYAVGGTVIKNDLNIIPLPQPDLYGTFLAGNEIAFMVLFDGIILNILLNLLNLVPIYPLDGGQIARQVMVQMDRFNGVRNSIILSIASAILIAVVCIRADATFMAVFFGFMAFSNYQSLQQVGRSGW